MSLLNTVVILITALNWFSSAVTFSAEGIPYSTVYVQGEQREIRTFKLPEAAAKAPALGD